MFSTSWSICGIDTDGHDLTLSRLVAWGESGALVPTSVASALTPIAGTVDNLLEDDATTVTFAAADVRQPGFLITFEFAEPVELWGWRMAAPTQTGWPRMHAVQTGEHVQFLGWLEWQGSGVMTARPANPVSMLQKYGDWTPLSAAGTRRWFDVATHDGVIVYAGDYGGQIYKSTDDGATWVALSSAGSRKWCGIATHDGVIVYAVDYGGWQIYKCVQLDPIYVASTRALAVLPPVTAGAPLVEPATLGVEPVFTTLDLDVGGRGRIYGTVKRKADPQNIPLVRRVRLHDSRTGALLRQTWSREDGSYEFRDLNPDLEFDVVAWDHERHFRSEIANNLKSEVQA